MFVGKVVGTVWSTVKWPGMTGHKLLLDGSTGIGTAPHVTNHAQFTLHELTGEATTFLDPGKSFGHSGSTGGCAKNLNEAKGDQAGDDECDHQLDKGHACLTSP